MSFFSIFKCKAYSEALFVTLFSKFIDDPPCLFHQFGLLFVKIHVKYIDPHENYQDKQPKIDQ